MAPREPWSKRADEAFPATWRAGAHSSEPRWGSEKLTPIEPWLLWHEVVAKKFTGEKGVPSGP